MRQVYVSALLLVCLLGFVCESKPATTAKCGYASCDMGKPGMINVHLIPHTHDDVGWLKTVDQYYYGYKTSIQRAGVQYIIDTVMQELKVGGPKRFIYVEIGYFSRWWNEQNEQMKTFVKSLVDNGNLQFILGGWCMNDEASTHYAAIIDQHTLGLKFLKDNFGECGRPLVAWQIDPFGHSREQASLFAQMGYDGLYFMRLDYQDKSNRFATKTLELLWNGYEDLPGTDLFTNVLNGTYCPPAGYCFDDQCADDPIMDDSRMHDYNVKSRVDGFIQYAEYQAKYYTTNHILIPMGCDFQFQNANAWYKNLDKLIKYANARQLSGSKYNFMYSTPSCYTYAVNKARATYTAPKKDDFFPYADGPNSFWTGYFTSRPALKYMVRRTNAFLQAVKQLSVFSKLPPLAIQPKIDPLRQAMGVLQHHDAVSGTEKQAVAYDYAQRLALTSSPALDSVRLTMAALTGINNNFVMCPLLNTSSCNFTINEKSFSVVLYNPASQPRNHWLHLPINDIAVNYQIHDAHGASIPFAFLKVSAQTAAIPEGKNHRGSYEILFNASLPALGYAYYTITAVPKSSIRMMIPPMIEQPRVSSFLVINNGLVSITFDRLSGMLLSIKNVKNNVEMPLQATLKYYTGWQTAGRASGAYCFRPNEEIPNGWSTAALAVQENGLVKEVHQTFTSWLSLVYRVYEGESHVEIEWTVGPIPKQDNVGREVIMHYKTPFAVNNCFTDANGRQMLQRVINHRPTWNFKNTEPVSGNYYPINSRILIRDPKNTMQFAVLTDRSEGGGCPRVGELELMLHRRTIKDDGFGVGEPLNELGSDGKGLIVRGRHLIHVDTLAQSTVFQRQRAATEFMQPTVLFTPNTVPAAVKSSWSALRMPLPKSVQLLTLENWDGNSKLVRFEHLYQRNEYSAAPVTFNIANLFVNLPIKKAVLMNLAANQKLSETKRLSWAYTGGTANTTGSGATLTGTTLTLQPMAIATLVVN